MAKIPYDVTNENMDAIIQYLSSAWVHYTDQEPGRHPKFRNARGVIKKAAAYLLGLLLSVFRSRKEG